MPKQDNFATQYNNTRYKLRSYFSAHSTELRRELGLNAKPGPTANEWYGLIEQEVVKKALATFKERNRGLSKIIYEDLIMWSLSTALTN
jgi:hypothetical protein